MKVELLEMIEPKFPGAVEVAPGKFAALAEDREHYFVIADTEALKPHGPHWVTDMPKWWSPEKRYAVPFDGDGGSGEYTFATLEEASEVVGRSGVVTADLETGDEVSA